MFFQFDFFDGLLIVVLLLNVLQTRLPFMDSLSAVVLLICNYVKTQIDQMLPAIFLARSAVNVAATRPVGNMLRDFITNNIE